MGGANNGERAFRLDPGVLEPLRELGGDEFVHKLFATFVDHAPERLADLRIAAEQRDPEALARATHSLRSASATLGALELSKFAGRLEELADEGEIGALIDELPELEQAVAALAEQLSSELGLVP